MKNGSNVEAVGLIVFMIAGLVAGAYLGELEYLPFIGVCIVGCIFAIILISDLIKRFWRRIKGKANE
jgi:hypothetical protein